MGAKTKTEYALTKPQSQASKGRTYALYCAVGVDVQECTLTNKAAHDYLNRANGGEAYHVRADLLALDGAREGKRDVAKEHRDDPKPGKKAKSKPEPTTADVAKHTSAFGDETTPDETKTLIAMLKSRPGLLKNILAQMEDEETEDEPEPEPKPKATPKKKTAATPKKKGTKVNTKNGANVTIADDDTISDDDLLKMLGKAMGA